MHFSSLNSIKGLNRRLKTRIILIEYGKKINTKISDSQQNLYFTLYELKNVENQCNYNTLQKFTGYKYKKLQTTLRQLETFNLVKRFFNSQNQILYIKIEDPCLLIKNDQPYD